MPPHPKFMSNRPRPSFASINPSPCLLEDKLIKSAKAIYILGIIIIRYFDFKLCLRRKHRGNISPEIVYRRIYATERQCFKNYFELRFLLILRLSIIYANKASDIAVKFLSWFESVHIVPSRHPRLYRYSGSPLRREHFFAALNSSIKLLWSEKLNSRKSVFSLRYFISGDIEHK